jgi:hypothetical protein
MIIKIYESEKDIKIDEGKLNKKLFYQDPYVKIFTINGAYFNEEISAGFVDGGNSKAYPGIIPNGEYYIDENLLTKINTPEGAVKILSLISHEAGEDNIMSELNVKYEKAHECITFVESLIERLAASGLITVTINPEKIGIRSEDDNMKADEITG